MQTMHAHGDDTTEADVHSMLNRQQRHFQSGFQTLDSLP